MSTPTMSPAELAGLPQAEPPRIAPMAPPPPRPPAAVAAAFAAELREIQARLERMRKENHFQILGVPESADATAVRAAYFKLAKLFHPDTVPHEAPPELGRAKAEIFTAVGEANRILSDDASRARYRESLASGGPAEVDVQAVLAAEDTFNKGTALVRARRFPEAVKTFDDAIAANPREGEFYAWRGYARFFTLPDKKVAMVEALRDLNQSLKLNERCAPAHYFIGQLYKLTGDPGDRAQALQALRGAGPAARERPARDPHRRARSDMSLDGKQRRKLRALGHHLAVVVQVGQDGRHARGGGRARAGALGPRAGEGEARLRRPRHPAHAGRDARRRDRRPGGPGARTHRPALQAQPGRAAHRAVNTGVTRPVATPRGGTCAPSS